MSIWVALVVGFVVGFFVGGLFIMWAVDANNDPGANP